MPKHWFLILTTVAALPAAEWPVPPADAGVANPLPRSQEAIKAGHETYGQYCIVCHGAAGLGDGDGAAALNPKPPSFADPAVRAQSDGAFFWKIANGRSAMPGWKDILSEQQRWELVHYLRTLATDPGREPKK